MTRAKRPPLREEADNHSPLAKEIARGLMNAIEYAKGGEVRANVSTLELPDPAPDYAVQEIRKERLRLGLTQQKFAALMNVSVKTVEAWESGRKMPGPPSRRLLQLLCDDDALRIVAENAGYRLVRKSDARKTAKRIRAGRGVKK